MLMLLKSFCFHSAAANLAFGIATRLFSRVRVTGALDTDEIDLDITFLLLYYLQPTCYALIYLFLTGDRDRKCPEERGQLRNLLRQ